MKTIGLIGGMSWESTAHYYATLNKEAARHLGGLHSAPILLHSLDFAPIAKMQELEDWGNLAALLADSAQKLQRAGADLIALSTNTMHIVADEIIATIDVPFIHIADATAQALIDDDITNVGLLGTRFTMEKPFYKQRLIDLGLNPLIPDNDHTNLNAIIYEELCRGIVRDQSRQTYIKAIERLAAQGADAVILGCTEIGMLIDDSVSPLPVYDTTELHAKALVNHALQ